MEAGHAGCRGSEKLPMWWMYHSRRKTSQARVKRQNLRKKRQNLFWDFWTLLWRKELVAIVSTITAQFTSPIDVAQHYCRSQLKMQDFNFCVFSSTPLVFHSQLPSPFPAHFRLIQLTKVHIFIDLERNRLTDITEEESKRNDWHIWQNMFWFTAAVPTHFISEYKGTEMSLNWCIPFVVRFDFCIS